MADLTGLLNLLDEAPAHPRLVHELKQLTSRVRLIAPDAARPYLLAALHHQLRYPILVVTARPETTRKLCEQLDLWATSASIKIFPEPDALPYEHTTTEAATGLERLQALYTLARGSGVPVIVASALALVQKTVPYRAFTTACHTVSASMNISPHELLSRWQRLGYQMESIVEVPGTISHRGGIVDIYPPNNDMPARLEFFGNIIESIRLFDPASQRSRAAVPEIEIGPATELLADPHELQTTLSHLDLTNCNAAVREELNEEITGLLSGQRPRYPDFYTPLFNQDNLLSYLPLETLIVLDEPRQIELALDELEQQGNELRRERLQRGDLPTGYPIPYCTRTELDLASQGHLALAAWEDTSNKDAVSLDFKPVAGYAGQLPLFVNKVKETLVQKRRVIIVSHEAERLAELLEEADIMATPTTEVKQIPPPGSLTLVPGLLDRGWVMGEDTYLFTDSEIFGFVKQRRQPASRPVSRHKLLMEISPGDYVVHIEHGVARFGGVTTLSTDGGQREYLVLRYAAGDRLYVPTDQIDRVSRYVGSSDQPPVLTRLGTQEWTRAKQRVKESVAEIAEELLALYAAREVVPGLAASEDALWQQEMESAFPYVETPDQLEAIRQVKEDMMRPRPMDRLVSGDVGYGKTEVAIRAAFKAVMDGRQVAVLVPTTVLAQQHLYTFNQRLEAFPVRIEVLSRFKSPKEQDDIIAGLANGSVDICIGTHRLLQKDVVFKDLGLLVIDEEQRFGVNHKEHFKQLRQAVDVLTLSATPIPRTLHMSLVGVRDMSTMETPPEERLPIKTHVGEYDERLIREAVLRELERNGQVFFVHNRVQSIAYVAGKLQKIVPEARLGIAHGRMPEHELERVMADFTKGNTDVLVCTTIIESGLDMPNVNTLIVNQADRLGLTQLYQLRGRVGRGANLAHAYFLYDRGKRLTPNAEKRLKTIFRATELGAGFDIAMRDLEIRGAGTLLGTRQSGHISAVGFSLYTRLLAEAVEESKAGRAGVATHKPPTPPSPSIDLPLDARIPEYYVADIDTRLNSYQKLARVERLEQLEDLRQEFLDRFGPVPEAADNLLYAVRVKLLAMNTGIESVSYEHGQIVVRLFQGLQFTPEQRQTKLPEGARMHANQVRLNIKRLGERWREVLVGVIKWIGNK